MRSPIEIIAMSLACALNDGEITEEECRVGSLFLECLTMPADVRE